LSIALKYGILRFSEEAFPLGERPDAEMLEALATASDTAAAELDAPEE